MSNYDKELINSRIFEVCDHYLPGEGRRQGQKRMIWECPACGGDHFTANSEGEIAGCLSAGCPAPRAEDAIGIIAYFEDLEPRGSGFVDCLRKGYEILAIPEPEDEQSPRRSSKARSVKPAGDGPPPQQHPAREDSPRAGGDSATAGATTVERGPISVDPPATVRVAAGITMPGSPQNHRDEEAGPGGESGSQKHRELLHAVYSAWIEMCPLQHRDRRFWHSRGVHDDTIEEGGFGSLSPDRCRYALDALEKRFGREELLTVPGFKEGPNRNLHTNLYGDYTLIPYYDRDGYIITVEGRVPGQPAPGAPKYMAPVGAENHLYVFPRYAPEQLTAFCEGLIGAVVAAQAGIPVASIKGCRCYRTPTRKGESDLPLPQLRGVDFERRRRLYIADLDVKAETREEVEELAPEAARWLIEEQNGTALVARLPEGYKDLDEWLLAVHEAERVPRFASLIPSALTPEQWKGPAPLEEPEQEPQEPAPENGGPDANQAPEARKAGGEVRRSVVEGGLSSGSGESKPPQPQQTRSGSGVDREAATPRETKVKTRVNTRVRTRPPQPRAYTPIKWTNLGEFLVALLYGVLAGVACLSLLAYAAPDWQATAFMAEIPLWISVAVSAAVAIGVLLLVRRKLYVRRWRGLRDHLAGRQT